MVGLKLLLTALILLVGSIGAGKLAAQAPEQLYRFSANNRPSDTSGLAPATYLNYAWRLSALAQHEEAGPWRRRYHSALALPAAAAPPLPATGLDAAPYHWPDSIRVGLVALSHPQDYGWVYHQLDHWIQQGFTRLVVAEPGAMTGTAPGVSTAAPACQRLFQRLHLNQNCKFLRNIKPQSVDLLLSTLKPEWDDPTTENRGKVLILAAYGHPAEAWPRQSTLQHLPANRRGKVLLLLPLVAEELAQHPSAEPPSGLPTSEKKRSGGLSWQVLVHPPATYQQGRADWECTSPFRRVELLPALLQVTYPCIVEAYPQNTGSTGWPVDVVELHSADQLPALVLPPGLYRLYLRDQKGGRQWLELEQR